MSRAGLSTLIGIGLALLLAYANAAVAVLNARDNTVWNQDSTDIIGDGEAGDMFGRALAVGDFDGDGFDDFAAGAPGEEVGGIPNAGAVNVFYGSAIGITASGDQYFTQGGPGGLPGVAESGDSVGSALAVGDFDRDGFDDLAIGVSSEGEGSAVNSGIVQIVYGRAQGLNPNRIQTLDQASLSSLTAEDGDQFGFALTVGDFDGDGFDDLAIGAPTEDVGSITDAGVVTIVYGALGGLNAARHRLIEQEDGNSLGEAGDLFGSVLSSGDYNGDGFDDLAISATSEDLFGVPNAGAVDVFYGPQFARADHQFITRADDFGANTPIGFGNALASGDFDNDGRDDLLIGLERNTDDGQFQAGAILIKQSSAAGLRDRGLPARFEGTNAFYGSAIVLGDFNGTDSRFNSLDFAVGAYGVNAEAGAVDVVYSSPDFSFSQTWDQDSPGIAGTREAGDGFGLALASGDFDNNGFDDLLIGAPGEALGNLNGAGTVNVIYGVPVLIFSSGFEN